MDIYSQPDITEKLWVHDHYRNKGPVEPIYRAFPSLIDTYGLLENFEFYLLEPQSVEDEGRLEALNEGVIFDLASHLFAYVQLFFLEAPHPALLVPDQEVQSVRMQIKSVARARYAKCAIRNRAAETFAAIVVTIQVTYRHVVHDTIEEQEIEGLLVVGKGIKPSQSTAAALKGMRFKQELNCRCVNVSKNAINPPLTDLEFSKTEMGENGFNRSVVDALRHRREALTVGKQISSTMTFDQAAMNSRYLSKAIEKGKDHMIHYSVGDTIDAVLAKCVGAKKLESKWLSESGYADIGFGT